MSIFVCYLLWKASCNAIEGGEEPDGDKADLLPDDQLMIIIIIFKINIITIIIIIIMIICLMVNSSESSCNLRFVSGERGGGT